LRHGGRGRERERGEKQQGGDQAHRQAGGTGRMNGE
jgi:hypothetical protein